MRIAVFNTYDMTPGENGGETRLLNIYRRLSRTHEVRFVSYELRCPSALKRSLLQPDTEIITAGVSQADRDLLHATMARLGRYPHDVLCASGYALTDAFLAEVDAAMAWADVVIATQPYFAGLVFPRCGAHQMKVYEAHNAELRVKRQYLSGSNDAVLASRFVAETARCEECAVSEADAIVVVSEGDAEALVEDYGADPAKITVVANGVSVAAFDAVSVQARLEFRKLSGLSGSDVGVFLGSAYGPNVDSYRLTRQWLHQAGFQGEILLIGRIADAYDSSWPQVGFRERWLGFVEDSVKQLCVGSADFALQVVTAGGGTNLKLFDYMAAGIPILANAFGTRGVNGSDWFIPVDTVEQMTRVVAQRSWAGERAKSAAKVAHDIARRDFDWDNIAAKYGAILS